MQLHEFYEQVLPPTGHYAVFRSSTKQHEWASTIAELVELTERHVDATDCYFATASFAKPGKRTQENVNLLKAFRLDLDAGAKKLEKHGADKVYANQHEALVGLVEFSKAASLPPSLVVSSGEGLHVYYVLDEPAAPVAWVKVALSFNRFAKAHGLKVDTAVTADSARILRPIGTTHPNGKQVSVLKNTGKVYELSEFYAAVATGDSPEDEDDWAAGASFTDAEINDAVAVQGPPKDMDKILQRCANVRWAYENQARVDEPYWRAMIGLTKHVVDGEQWAHKVSSQHPEYSKRDTQYKFDRWETGPSTCATFDDCNSSGCAGCEHKGKIKSPIQLGAMTTQEVESLPEELKPQTPEPVQRGNPWDGHIPKGFDIITHKGIQTIVHYMDVERENEVGDTITVRITVPVSFEVFWLGHWSDAETGDDTAKTTVFRLDSGNRVSAFVMDQSLVASQSELSKFLAGKGIHSATDKRSPLAMTAYVKHSLQKTKLNQNRVRVSDHFGLRNLPDGRLVSAHGRYIIFPDGKISESIMPANLLSASDQYLLPIPSNAVGEWDASVWKTYIVPHALKHIEFIKKYYAKPGLEKYQLAMMLGLASPMMAFATGAFTRGSTLPGNGLSVSMYSKGSGIGKTAVMHCAILAYASVADAARDSNNMASTDLARTTLLSFNGTMPATMDEMGSTNAKSIASLVSAIANGAARISLRSDGTMKSNAKWALIALLATNRSQRDMINEAQADSEAVQYRLLELDVDNMPKFDAELRRSFSSDWKALSASTGALGALIQLLIVKRGSQWMSERMDAMCLEASQCVASDNQSARFQYRGLASVLLLQEMLEANGLAFFSKKALIEAFRTAHDSAAEYIKDNSITLSPLEKLSRALFDMSANTVITVNETKRTGTVTVYDSAINRVPDVVKCRHIISNSTTYVSVDAFKKWCIDNHERPSEILGSAKKTGVMKHVYVSNSGRQWACNFNLLKGMRESTGSYVSCYAFDTDVLSKLVGSDTSKIVVDTLKNSVIPISVVRQTTDAA